MTGSQTSWRSVGLAVGLVVLAAAVGAAWWFAQDQKSFPRGEALGVALRPLLEQDNTEQSLVARAIWANYLETRANASRWSGIYWGFTFLAAALGALAGLILKCETIVKTDALKKDLAAIFSIAAALLITISSSGDFQRKWQANRIAAAELERTGYEFLAKNGANPRSYFAAVAQILHQRQVAIIGSMERPAAAPEFPNPEKSGP